MRFSEIVKEAKELLRGKGRVTYRALKLEFDLDDERLDVLKDELIKAERVAMDEAGEILVWIGNGIRPHRGEANTPPSFYADCPFFIRHRKSQGLVSCIIV